MQGRPGGGGNWYRYHSKYRRFPLVPSQPVFFDGTAWTRDSLSPPPGAALGYSYLPPPNTSSAASPGPAAPATAAQGTAAPGSGAAGGGISSGGAHGSGSDSGAGGRVSSSGGSPGGPGSAGNSSSSGGSGGGSSGGSAVRLSILWPAWDWRRQQLAVRGAGAACQMSVAQCQLARHA